MPDVSGIRLARRGPRSPPFGRHLAKAGFAD
jgi:hypothetical protein